MKTGPNYFTAVCLILAQWIQVDLSPWPHFNCCQVSVVGPGFLSQLLAILQLTLQRKASIIACVSSTPVWSGDVTLWRTSDNSNSNIFELGQAIMWCLFERPAPGLGQTKRQLWVPRLGDQAPNTRSDPLGFPFTALVKIPGFSCIVHCACIMSRKYRHSSLRGSLSEFVYVYSTRQNNTAVFLWQLDNPGQDYIKHEQTFKIWNLFIECCETIHLCSKVVRRRKYKLEAKLANNKMISNFAFPKIAVFCFSFLFAKGDNFDSISGISLPKRARKQLVYICKITVFFTHLFQVCIIIF